MEFFFTLLLFFYFYFYLGSDRIVFFFSRLCGRHPGFCLREWRERWGRCSFSTWVTGGFCAYLPLCMVSRWGIVCSLCVFKIREFFFFFLFSFFFFSFSFSSAGCNWAGASWIVTRGSKQRALVRGGICIVSLLAGSYRSTSDSRALHPISG